MGAWRLCFRSWLRGLPIVQLHKLLALRSERHSAAFKSFFGSRAAGGRDARGFACRRGVDLPFRKVLAAISGFHPRVQVVSHVWRLRNSLSRYKQTWCCIGATYCSSWVAPMHQHAWAEIGDPTRREWRRIPATVVGRSGAGPRGNSPTVEPFRRTTLCSYCFGFARLLPADFDCPLGLG